MTKTLLLRTHENDKGVAFSLFARKNLNKREVGKLNAPAAPWARLSVQGIFPSAFNLWPTSN